MRLKDTIISKMNELGKAKKPFLFVLSFNEQEGVVQELDQVDSDILFNFNGVTNTKTTPIESVPLLTSFPISFESYQDQFTQVQTEIGLGNTYLINLTIETPITLNCTLNNVFHAVQAKYKLFFKNQLVCFSPETFVQIKDNSIYSFPMKGTIDATLPHAEEQLLSDEKENAEHYTIVDLIRNDLNIVAKNVKVDRFKYLDYLKTSKGAIFQMSSQISGDLPSNWEEQIGTIFQKLLPAGSITGSPKARTVDIIQAVETHNRNYYTGVCGIYDGNNLDSGVMIRYIENTPKGMVYKSGGGITFSSEASKEYAELIQKVYIPL
ncbi:MAG: aminodeoxychorismate synthase component I [Flavobacteriaceae bacterium]|jgi:para-aminobenzoate synthetase component 1|nr:aminodeoxychorismate synthase component I [Flavobacteriaceae bacterium]